MCVCVKVLVFRLLMLSKFDSEVRKNHDRQVKEKPESVISVFVIVLGSACVSVLFSYRSHRDH